MPGAIEYEKGKRILNILFAFFPGADEVSTEAHPLTVLSALEAGGMRKAREGLRMAMNDALEMSLTWPTDVLQALSTRLQNEVGISLQVLQQSYLRNLEKILDRGSISDEAEYHLVREFFLRLHHDDPVAAACEQVLIAFENRSPSGNWQLGNVISADPIGLEVEPIKFEATSMQEVGDNTSGGTDLMQCGGVFLRGGKLRRIVVFDEKLVFFDTWDDASSSWDMQLLERTAWYMGLPVPIFFQGASFVRTEPLSSEELRVHRPDLPLRLAQSQSMEWPMGVPDSLDDFVVQIGNVQEAENFRETVMNAASIYLCAFGAKGGMKPPVLITAINGKAFSTQEVLWRAAQLQAASSGTTSAVEGVGIYRAGIVKKLPAYYLWGAKGRAGI